MKKKIYLLALVLVVFSCANNSKTNVEISDENVATETSDESIDNNEIYKRNSNNLKALFDYWQAGDVESSISLLAEDFTETGTGYGDKDRNRDEHKAQMEGMMSIMKTSLRNAIYLPGVDTVNFDLDGSVRYYGIWNFSVGEKSEDLKVYGTADFNDDGLITSLAHYADFNMTMMQILPEEVMKQMMGSSE
jgi:hypothetical protein